MSTTVRSRPKIYLVVILPILCFGGFTVIELLLHCFTFLRGIPASEIPFANAMLIGLPAILLWISISLLLSNLILFAIGHLRQVAEQYAAAANRPGFRDSQKNLLKLTGCIAIICLPLIVLGFWL